MPLIWFTLFYFGGILTADAAAAEERLWWTAAAAVSCLIAGAALICIRKWNHPARYWILIGCCAGAFLGGGLRFTAVQPELSDPGFITQYTDRPGPLQIKGEVTDDPLLNDSYLTLEIEVQKVRRNSDQAWAPVHGRLLAQVHPAESIHYGDRVLLEGWLETPPEGKTFSYREYLARQGIYAFISDPETELISRGGGCWLMGSIYRFRSHLREQIYRLWPDPEASLLAGILLGIESEIPEPVERAFRRTGTSHVIAISGFNITIVAGLFTRMSSRLFRPQGGALTAVLGITLYTLLVGADPAVVRAALMGGLGVVGHQIGRQQHGVNAAAAASLLMGLVNPQLPWDLSFQLSLAATLGLIFYADPLTRGFHKLISRVLGAPAADRIIKPVSEYILLTFAAQLTTFPVMMVHFRKLPLSTFLVNPIILPVQPPIMVLGGLALLSGAVWPPLGQLTSPLVFPFITFTIRMVEWFSALPIRSLHTGENSLAAAVGYYLVLGLLTVIWNLGIDLQGWISPTVQLGTGLAVVLIVWRVWFCLPDGNLQLTFCSVGSGEGIHVKTPGGRRVLINGGPSASLLSDCLGRELPPFSHELDWLVVASTDPRDLAGLVRVLDRFPPDQVLWVGEMDTSRESQDLADALQERSIRTIFGEQGMQLLLDGGGKLELIYSGPQGGILLLEYQSFRALLPFTGNRTSRESLRMGKEVGKVSVLMLADQGYAPANPPDWIAGLDPQVLVLSAGDQEFEGLPDPRTREFLAGYTLLRTDQQGRIKIRTGGSSMQIQVDRLP